MKSQEDLVELEKRLELAEYQIRERIEEKLWKRIIRWGTIAGLGLTLITVIGVPSLISSIGKSAIEEIKTEIKDETTNLSERLSKDLAKLTVITAALEADAEKAKEAVNKSEKYTAQLENLNKRLNELSNEATALRKKAEDAIASARVASEDTQNLRSSFAESTAGEPVILGWNSGSNKPSIDFQVPDVGRFSGNNFGSNPGKVFSIAIIYPAKHGRSRIPYSDMKPSDLLLLEAASIDSWTNTEVGVKFTEQDKKRLSEVFDRLGRSTTYYATLHFVVETADGSRSRVGKYGSRE